MSATPGFRLVARKGLPRANPGLIVDESYGFADVFNTGRYGFDDGFVDVFNTDRYGFDDGLVCGLPANP